VTMRTSLIRTPNFSFKEKMMTLKKTKKNWSTLCLIFYEDQLEVQSMTKIRGGDEDEGESEPDPNP